MAEATISISGWGRTAPTTPQQLSYPHSAEEVARAVFSAGARGLIARGLGRSYGDAAQNAGGTVLNLRHLDTAAPINPITGELTCGAGLSLDALLRYSLPQGWFLPVTPGTRHVSVGGAVAADVHGKNHHRDGTISRHLTALELVDGQGELRRLTPSDELFSATVGGMGLTGVLTSVTLAMIPVDSAWMSVDTHRTADLDETMASITDGDSAHRYSVAWIDCLARGRRLGRGVVTRGEHLPAAALSGSARADPLQFAPAPVLTAPPWIPSRLLGRPLGAAFNEAYYRRAPRSSVGAPLHLAQYFYPLDGITEWNRLYGAPGFVQYQFLTPDPETVRTALERLQRAHAPGLLAVLKKFGTAAPAPLSFPAPGWTLAVDIPARVPGLGAVLDEIDEIVVQSGGRVYLAKDARLSRDMLQAMYPELNRWRELRSAADPRRVFSSDLSRRLHL